MFCVRPPFFPFVRFPSLTLLAPQQSEFALLVSGDSAQDIISRCHYHNERIHWETLMALPMVYFQNDPIEQFLNLEECHMLETAVYEPMVQPNDLVNEYDGPVCLSPLFREGAYV